MMVFSEAKVLKYYNSKVRQGAERTEDDDKAGNKKTNF